MKLTDDAKLRCDANRENDKEQNSRALSMNPHR